jgi:hypothetical protein
LPTKTQAADLAKASSDDLPHDALAKPVSLARLPDVLSPREPVASAPLVKAPLPVPAAVAKTTQASTEPPPPTHEWAPVTVVIKPESTPPAATACATKPPASPESRKPDVVQTQFVQAPPQVSGWKAAIARRWERE